jgi:hypothetical protein
MSQPNTALKFALRLLGYLVVGIFLLMGGYCILWAFQSASFSTIGEPLARTLHEIRAETMFPIGLLSVAVGILFLCELLRDGGKSS